MFKITSDIEIGNFKAVKPSALKWSKDIDNYSDSCTITLPTIAMLKREGDEYEKVQTAQQFKEGMPVLVYVGYDGANDLHFKGFIRRINFTVPLEIECEGYSYQLRKKTNFSKSYRDGTNLKTVLNDIIAGTDIKLHPSCRETTFSAIRFENGTGIDALEKIKDKMGLTVFFEGEYLFVGLRETVLNGSVKYRLGWNVIKDNELKFSTEKEYSKVNIVLEQPKDKDGSSKRIESDSKYDDVYVIRLAVKYPDEFAKQLTADKKKSLQSRGYGGAITTFLKPFVRPSATAIIDDPKYPERTGRYFITGVEGSMGTSGGRLKIKIGNSL
jgi:hypothetical protein